MLSFAFLCQQQIHFTIFDKASNDLKKLLCRFVYLHHETIPFWHKKKQNSKFTSKYSAMSSFFVSFWFAPLRAEKSKKKIFIGMTEIEEDNILKQRVVARDAPLKRLAKSFFKYQETFQPNKKQKTDENEDIQQIR